MLLAHVFADGNIWTSLPEPAQYGLILLAVAASIGALIELAGLRYIPNNRVGIVEKLWSRSGSVEQGRLISLGDEAGFKADVLRGGFHIGLWRWMYRLHKVPLVTVPQGKIGYVYARDGESLAPSQTLGRVAASNNFQDAREFLQPEDAVALRGQRGRQRAILREGMYAINLALFIVITEDAVFHLNFQMDNELNTLVDWQRELERAHGFSPVVIGASLPSAPARRRGRRQESQTRRARIAARLQWRQHRRRHRSGRAVARIRRDHRAGSRQRCQGSQLSQQFPGPRSFLAAGGRRGRQYPTLTDGTYFINRWFASVEFMPKTVVPIGFVGVVVSYYGRVGDDVSGTAFRHGERVASGERGVWEKPLGPGKYPFNTYAGAIIQVPTTNFVLHWITGKSESHHYDDSLKSIDLVTKDAYEPNLPLSVVVHIDYQRAPSVIQRFGDVKKLITQTLDPMFERVLPRHRPQEDDARITPATRRHSRRGPRGAAPQVPRFRHRMR